MQYRVVLIFCICGRAHVGSGRVPGLSRTFLQSLVIVAPQKVREAEILTPIPSYVSLIQGKDDVVLKVGVV